ncbi:MAG: murein peptide amidase A [Bdellovibrio sp.]|nr:MAG: murein peptide amidase A [Bdellovibrio sp.]
MKFISLFTPLILLMASCQTTRKAENSASTQKSAHLKKIDPDDLSPFEDLESNSKSNMPPSHIAVSENRVQTKKAHESHGSLSSFCQTELSSLPGKFSEESLKKVCRKVTVKEGCESFEENPIFHYQKNGYSKNAKRILVLSLIHGDEFPSGSVSRSWMIRLENIEPRNSWRVIPISNPDGLHRKTRTNARNVDINRNFPTKDWDRLALFWWRTKKKSDPRRYPGPTAASERETQCIMKHIDEYDPHFIISIHTPLGVLDFDGPKSIEFPRFSPLPWISLGNFPGSLGRYMWVDHNVPVLTIELKGSYGVKRLQEFDRLQDISGTVAIQSDRILRANKQRSFNDK